MRVTPHGSVGLAHSELFFFRYLIFSWQIPTITSLTLLIYNPSTLFPWAFDGILATPRRCSSSARNKNAFRIATVTSSVANEPGILLQLSTCLHRW